MQGRNIRRIPGRSLIRTFQFLTAAIAFTQHMSLAQGESLAANHPRPSYSDYSEAEVRRMAESIRESRPQMHRGGWEWDRLLSRYVDSGRKDPNELKILRAYFLSILDRYEEAKQKGEGGSFSLFYNHRSWGSGGRMRIFAELVRAKAITPTQEDAFKELVLQSLKVDFPDYTAIERGVNNRPFGINGGPAIAVKMFPDHPHARRHKPWLDALWRELTEYGDTTETNHNPYGPLYLQGLLDMAEGMGKFQSEREFLHAHLRRYLDYVHGGGVRGNPNSGTPVITDRDGILSNPWNAEYYGGAEHVNDGHVWYRAAREFKDPEFLWASEQVLLGGRPPQGTNLPPEYLAAYERRYFWFTERGIKPQVPGGGSKIGFYSPLKHKVPERLYLCPDRESGSPFVSFYIYDRNNNYMHYCDDSDGKLYEYGVDGAKFLHTSGKYSSGRAGVGEAAYDMLSVLPPDMPFPMAPDGTMGTPAGDTWKMASMSIKVTLPSREGPDSKNWIFDDTIGKFRRRDEPLLGYSHGNMDGYWYLNNEYHLTSLQIGDFAPGTRIQGVRLAGPKGEKILLSGETIPDNLRIELAQGEKRVPLEGPKRKEVLRIVRGGRRPGNCFEVGEIGSDARLVLTLENLDERFDGQEEYTRFSYDFLGREGGRVTPNVRTNPRYVTPLWHRGAILVREDLRAENKGRDSFGQFTMRNYYGARSSWTRQAVLTTEGYLVVRDRYEPCSDVDGYQASPCWMLKADGDVAGGARTWWDAPARDHAWWQTRKKRVILYQHPGPGMQMGQVAHRVSQDIKSGPAHNTYSRVILEAGKPRIWLTVLRPFNEGEDAAAIAGTIRTTVNRDGDAAAKIGDLSVLIDASGSWSVNR